MKKLLKITLFLLVLLFIFLSLGPRPDKFEVDPIIQLSTSNINALDKEVAEMESKFDIRPGNQAQIIWADSNHQKTPYSIVYLHGFSASHMEGNPVHRALARRYGMNLYLSRLDEHGLKGENALEHFNASRFIETSKEALKIGQTLGEDVIVIGTSTGATAAIYLAAHNPELLDILLFFAPNIDVADPRAFLLTYPWGQQLAEFLEGDYLNQGMSGVEFDKYWNPTYRTSSVIELGSLIANMMSTDIFSNINQPTFISYYYKNENEHDDIISVERIQDFYNEIGTTADKKRMLTTPKSGNHVTISNITSKDIVTPFDQACAFLEEVCGIEVMDQTSKYDLLGLADPSN